MDPRKVDRDAYDRKRSPRSIAKSWISSLLCLVPASYALAVVAFALRNSADYATAVPQFVRYIAAPGLLAALLVHVALKGSRVARVNIGGAACCILAAMFVYEYRMETRYWAAISALIGSTDAGNDGIHGLPLRRTVKSLNRQLGTTVLRDAVLGGVPHSDVPLCRDAGRHLISYRADRYGFRNPDTERTAPVGLMLVGDSFVEGICLQTGDDLLSQIRRRGVEPVGLGMRGAGPLLELAMLGRFGPVFRPRQVILVFYEGNDWEDLSRELGLPWLRETLNEQARFGAVATPAATADRIRRQIAAWNAAGDPKPADVLRKAHVMRNFFALHQTWTQLGLGYPKAARTIPEYRQVVERGRNIAAAWGGDLAILYVPQTSRFVGFFPDQFVYDQVRDQVRAAAASYGIQFIDLTTTFARHRDAMSLYDRGHLSPRGAALAARIIVDNLRPTGAGETPQ